MATATHKHFSANTKGRDFVVGDIHGELEMLKSELVKVGFDHSKDRLFSVGDMVDRGHNSLGVLQFFYDHHDSCFAVRGNHEQMLLDAVNQGTDHVIGHHIMNGGDWFYALNSFEQGFSIGFASTLPYAISVDTSYGTVGIIHAQPYGTSWRQMLLDLPENQHVRDMVLWSREIVRSKGDPEQFRVQDITRVYCGHTILHEPTDVANISFIDTGAVFGRKLTLLQISP